MDTNNTSPQGLIPGSQPGVPHRPMQPMARRPMVDGFVPRRPMQIAPGVMPMRTMPSHPAGHVGPMPAFQPQPVAKPQPMHTVSPTVAPPRQLPPHPQVPAPQPHPSGPAVAHRPMQTHSDFVAPPRPAVSVAVSEPPAAEPTVSTSRPGREKNRTGHAGLVGFIVFILLGALLLSPFVPGKIMNNFPFASSSYSTGDQSLNCIGTQGRMTSTTGYNTKAGAPITYTYSTSTTQTATCDSQVQHAVAGETSQFNPLGLLVDVATALVVAIIVSRVWRLIFGEKRHSSRHRED